MDSPNIDIAKYIADEVEKYQGVMVPIKASGIERRHVKQLKCSQLHPNPDDEFCFPNIGPNYGIISDYVKMIARFNTLQKDPWDEPIIVQKVRPDGYMILNGHHRWAAALKCGFDPLPVSIVNLTQETDIKKMIRESTHDKRATLDLDEVVFCEDEDVMKEKPLPFPYNKVFKQDIRHGIPAILHDLSVRGYDIWLYSSKYYSFDYIKDYFKKYSVKVDGVITGTSRKTKNRDEMKKKADNLFREKYQETLHIDNDAVVVIRKDQKYFDEYMVHAEPAKWSQEVLGILRDL